LYSNYEVKKGDTIQKILKNYKIKNSEIQSVIQQYKKYVNSKQLLIGNKIEITIKKTPTNKGNSVIRISVPVTKSTTVEIKKNEEGKIISEKIITKFYKRKALAENIIKKSLYASAVNAKINPETIIEFA
jgi:murein DD-endopeptidase MepM/ murein hydrolase activator NlpD